MDIYGLVGKNISHSFSPDYFNQWFKKKNINAEYQLFDIDDISTLTELITNNENIVGLNVTIPYKKFVLNIMDEVHHVAHVSGSINTIKIQRKNGIPYLTGFNTDVIGFEKTLKPIIKNRKEIKALILGSGGSACSVAYVLRKLGVFFYFVSRQPVKVTHTKYEYLNKSDIEEYNLIINTTPLGMWPNTNDFPPIPYEYITSNNILYDLIYNPKETMFLKKGKEKGALCNNGLDMLEIQAKESWKKWKDKKFSFL